MPHLAIRERLQLQGKVEGNLESGHAKSELIWIYIITEAGPLLCAMLDKITTLLTAAAGINKSVVT